VGWGGLWRSLREVLAGFLSGPPFAFALVRNTGVERQRHGLTSPPRCVAASSRIRRRTRTRTRKAFGRVCVRACCGARETSWTDEVADVGVWKSQWQGVRAESQTNLLT